MIVMMKEIYNACIFLICWLILKIKSLPKSLECVECIYTLHNRRELRGIKLELYVHSSSFLHIAPAFTHGAPSMTGAMYM